MRYIVAKPKQFTGILEPEKRTEIYICPTNYDVKKVKNNLINRDDYTDVKEVKKTQLPTENCGVHNRKTDPLMYERNRFTEPVHYFITLKDKISTKRVIIIEGSDHTEAQAILNKIGEEKKYYKISVYPGAHPIYPKTKYFAYKLKPLEVKKLLNDGIFPRL